MKRAPTDYSSHELAALLKMPHTTLILKAATGELPLPDYTDPEAKEQYWRASTVAALIGAIGAPLGVDASALVEGMTRIEEGTGHD